MWYILILSGIIIQDFLLNLYRMKRIHSAQFLQQLWTTHTTVSIKTCWFSLSVGCVNEDDDYCWIRRNQLMFYELQLESNIHMAVLAI